MLREMINLPTYQKLTKWDFAGAHEYLATVGNAELSWFTYPNLINQQCSLVVGKIYNDQKLQQIGYSRIFQYVGGR